MWVYGSGSKLLFMSGPGKIALTIKIIEGFRQGCPLGTLLYCLLQSTCTTPTVEVMRGVAAAQIQRKAVREAAEAAIAAQADNLRAAAELAALAAAGAPAPAPLPPPLAVPAPFVGPIDTRPALAPYADIKAIVDDCALIGNAAQVIAGGKALQNSARAINLVLQWHKCKVLWFHDKPVPAALISFAAK